jgi:DNA-binding transcriptional MerR regulator/effector-binding domain-containing protein
LKGDGKQMDDYLTIQEFSKLSGVEASKLRYWDEIGLFSPMMRNPENNYRYYSTAQLLALNFVTVLSDLELPLKTIAELRQERDPAKLLNVLEKHETQMDMEMRNLRQRYSIIHARRELINIGVRSDEQEIAVRSLDDRTIILWPPNEYNEGDTFINPLATFIAQTAEHHINLSFPVGGYHDTAERFIAAPAKPDRFFSIDPIGTHTIKAGDYLVGYTRGYYGDVGDLPERMAAFAKERSVNLVGPTYTIYLHEEVCTQTPEQFLAQVLMSVSSGREAKAKADLKKPRH